MKKAGKLGICFLSALALILATLGNTALAEKITVHHGSREEMRVAVTMDDCYDARNLQKTLDICAEYDVPMTFFVLGSALKEKDATMWQAAVAAGHELGNHTFAHRNLSRLKPREILWQLGRAQQQVDTVLGYHYPMQVMRPPYGRMSSNGTGTLTDMISRAGYLRAVLWDVSQTDPDKAIHAVQPGSILLFHANWQDVQCLKKLIPALQAKGYTLCTVSQLLELPPVATSTDLYVCDINQM